MTREEILAAWQAAATALASKPAPEPVRIPTPLMAVSWCTRAANGHTPNIERVLLVARHAPAPATLDDLMALAICTAVAEAFKPEQDWTIEAALSKRWGVTVKNTGQP